MSNTLSLGRSHRRPAGSWPKSTAADYRATPLGPPWYQLIEGHLLQEPSPTSDHQIVSCNLGFALLKYLERRPLGKLFFAPLDVYLDEFNVFQPDIVVVLASRLRRVTQAGVEGAPDFVVEILSPTSRCRDRGEKLERYAGEGVREIWIVDPTGQTIEAFRPVAADPVCAATWGRDDWIQTPLLPGFRLLADAVFAL